MAAIEPEAVFVEVGLDVLSAKLVVDAEPHRFSSAKTRCTQGRTKCAAINPTVFGSCV
jgi:hypothetical protein